MDIAQHDPQANHRAPRRRTTRRRFLAAALATGAAPWIIPSRVWGLDGQTSPSNKITLGVLGVGDQGKADLGAFLGLPDVRVVAIGDIETALRSGTLCLLALISVQAGRKLTWDPKAEQSVHDDAANAMLQPRPFRGDWKLPSVDT